MQICNLVEREAASIEIIDGVQGTPEERNVQ